MSDREQIVCTYDDHLAHDCIVARLVMGDRVVSMVALPPQRAVLVVFERAPMISLHAEEESHGS